jgi:RNA polymerase sigma-70 factor (ECF subfamily)
MIECSAAAAGSLRVQARPGSPRLSEREFADGFQECRETLWCVAAGVMGRSADAADVLQEAAIIALAKLDRFEPGSDFVAWMSQIVRNVARNAGRRSRRRGEGGVGSALLDRVEAARAPVRPPADDFDALVGHALDSLAETARACLVLRVVRGLSYREISNVLDIPEGTAMSHVHRARAALRQMLAPDEPGPQGAH